MAFTTQYIGVRKIGPEENCPPVRVTVWFRISVRIKAEGGAIFLETFIICNISIVKYMYSLSECLDFLRWNIRWIFLQKVFTGTACFCKKTPF